MKNIPEIRIKGFEGEWKESVLQENLADNLRTNTLARAFLSDNDGEVLNVHYGDVLIKYGSLLNAAKDDIPHIKGSKAKDYSDFIQDGDIIFADTAEDETAGKCVEVINVGNNNIVSGLHTIACRPKHTFGKGFLGYYINSPKYHEQLYPLLQGIKVFSLNKSQLEQTEMRSPESLAEQQSLGSFFSSFDRLLSDHHRRLENLRRVKKSMLQKMFSQQGQTVPEIRFKGFSGEWEKAKLSTFLEVSEEKNSDNFYGIEDVLSVSGDYGVVNQIEFQGRSFAGASVAGYGVAETGDVIYTKSPLKSNPYGIIKTNKGKPGIVSVLYGVYHPIKGRTDSSFVQTYFESDARLNNYLRVLINKGSKNTLLISDEDALRGEVCFPSYEEQQRLSSFFTSLDNLINDEVNYIDQLTRVKSTLLQKMFV